MQADGIEIEERVALASHPTLGVGGPARYFARVGSEAALRRAIEWAHERELPLLLLGGGSNLLVSDAGFPGLVAHLAIRGVEARADGDAVDVAAGAGEVWDALVALAIARGWAGIETLSGIPGYVGATPIQNVGAYGQEVSETIVAVRAVDLESGEAVELSGDACDFAYRSSRFKQADRGRYAVTGVTFRLRPGGEAAVRYVELERELEASYGGSRELADVRDAVLAIRRRKSMVLDPDDVDSRSAGSFFVNPVVEASVADEVERRVASRSDDSPGRMPRHDAPGGVKLSAAWLIERAGFVRGYRRGRVGLSTKHTLAIVNRGGATAADVVALAREVRDGVRDQLGVALTPEPVFVGLSLD
jgi:UDP-N-acetylmuramate dehydrogenase